MSRFLKNQTFTDVVNDLSDLKQHADLIDADRQTADLANMTDNL